jgi:hypothetical protein
MSDFDVVMLYLCVAAVICGILAACSLIMNLKHSSDKPMGAPEWGPPGYGDPEDERLFFEAEVMLEVELNEKEMR